MSTNAPRQSKIICGLPVDPVTMPEAVHWARARWEFRHGARIATVNSSILVEGSTSGAVQDYVRQADLVVCDGMPLVWVSRLIGHDLPERVAGIDLLEALLFHASEDGRSVFFLGARPGIAEAAGTAMLRKYPRLQLVGVHHGHFEESQEGPVIDGVERLSVDLLVMSMGYRREAMVLKRLGRRMRCGVVIGTGGSLNVLAGRLTRAPRIVQRIGLEWGFRMVQEPFRLGPRYIRTALGLAALVTKEFLGGGERRQ